MKRLIIPALLAGLFSTSAFAKGPWLVGTFEAANPLYRSGKLTIKFEANRPTEIKTQDWIDGEITAPTMEPPPERYFSFDDSFVFVLKGKDRTGNDFEAKLIAGLGEVDSFILILPNGVQTIARRVSR